MSAPLSLKFETLRRDTYKNRAPRFFTSDFLHDSVSPSSCRMNFFFIRPQPPKISGYTCYSRCHFLSFLVISNDTRVRFVFRDRQKLFDDKKVNKDEAKTPLSLFLYMPIFAEENRLWMRSSLVQMRSSIEQMRSSLVWMRFSLVYMISSLVWMRSSLVWMRSSLEWIRSSLVWMRSSLVWMRSSLGGVQMRFILMWMRSSLDLMRSSLVWMRSSLVWMRYSLEQMRSSLVWMRSSLVWMRSSLGRMRSSIEWMGSSLVVRASDCQCRVETVLGSIPAEASDTVESEGRQMKQC